MVIGWRHNNFDVPANTQTVNPVTTTETGSGVGPFGQVDVIYNLKPRYGVGGYVRYAGAKVDLDSVPDANIGGL